MFFFQIVPRTRRYGLLSIPKTKQRINNLSCAVAHSFLGHPPDKVRQENSFLFEIKNQKIKTPKRKLFSHPNPVKDYVRVFT